MTKSEYESILIGLRELRYGHAVGEDTALDDLIGRCYSLAHVVYNGRDAVGTTDYAAAVEDLSKTLAALEAY